MVGRSIDIWRRLEKNRHHSCIILVVIAAEKKLLLRSREPRLSTSRRRGKQAGMESIELTMVELISNYYLDTDGAINYVGDPLGPTTRLFFFFSFLFSFFFSPLLRFRLIRFSTQMSWNVVSTSACKSTLLFLSFSLKKITDDWPFLRRFCHSRLKEKIDGGTTKGTPDWTNCVWRVVCRWRLPWRFEPRFHSISDTFSLSSSTTRWLDKTCYDKNAARRFSFLAGKFLEFCVSVDRD